MTWQPAPFSRTVQCGFSALYRRPFEQPEQLQPAREGRPGGVALRCDVSAGTVGVVADFDGEADRFVGRRHGGHATPRSRRAPPVLLASDTATVCRGTSERPSEGPR